MPKKLLGMLVIVLLFGIKSLAYSQSGDGTFTLTDIPSKFNSKYVVLEAMNNTVFFMGVQSINLSTKTIIRSRISNGRVTLPMWWFVDEEKTVGYDGNHTVEISIAIFESETLYDSNEIASIHFESVTFSNGSATKSFHDNDEFDENHL
jgi:hypothetical protein